MASLKLSVLVPTFRRHQRLEACLLGLSIQKRAADQIVVVVRPEDAASCEVLDRWMGALPVETVLVQVPGVIQALNLGLSQVHGEVICVTDDDTVPHPDWLERIEQHYLANPRLGGLGGRDIVTEHGATVLPRDVIVGRIAWYGRLYGNHHLGMGSARQVDFLKGANMSFRMAAIADDRFDTDLHGKGAQVHFEMSFCFRVRNMGWELIYDPAVEVEHYPSVRHDSDQRGKPALDAIENAAFNLYMMLRRYVQPSWKRALALCWARIIGTHAAPGVLRGLAFEVRGDRAGVARYGAARRAWAEASREAGIQKPELAPRDSLTR